MILEYHKIPFGTYHCPHCGLEFHYYGNEDRLICPQCTFDLTAYAMTKTASDPINTLAIQFAEQNRQDQRWVMNELQTLRHILSAIIAQEGGEYRIGDAYRFMARPDDELSFLIDVDNRCLRIKRPSTTPDSLSIHKPDPPKHEPMPDWML